MDKNLELREVKKNYGTETRKCKLEIHIFDEGILPSLTFIIIFKSFKNDFLLLNSYFLFGN
jgi:hypothetical protein